MRRFPTDAGEAEQPVDWPCSRSTSVTRSKDAPADSRQEAAVNPDFVCADAIFELQPVSGTASRSKRRQRQRRSARRAASDSCDPSTATAASMPSCAFQRLRDPGDQVEGGAAPADPADRCSRKATASLIRRRREFRPGWRRRISAARSGDKPGRPRRCCGCPPPWTTRLAVPEQLVDRAASPIDMAGHGRRGTTVSVWNSQPRTVLAADRQSHSPGGDRFGRGRCRSRSMR